MNAKRTLGIALTGAMAVSCMVAASAETATPDYKGHWSEAAMQQFVDLKLVQGDDGNAMVTRPDDNITRAEFIKLVNGLYGYTKEASDEVVQKYADMQDKGVWYYSEVAKGLAAGYINGDENGMRPEDPITRQEAMTIIGRILCGKDYKLSDEEIKAQTGSFQDGDKVADWADDFVAALIAEDVVHGDEEGLRPASNIKRAEAVTVLNQVPQYVEMNIPYADFYKAELNNEVKVDAMTSATKTKTRSGGMMSGGSYHVNADGSDITGITYAVRINRVDLLKSGYTQVDDARTITITTTNRGQTSTKDYVGKDSLFEADSYAYYPLSEIPETYKAATVKDGVISFGELAGDTEATKLTATAVLTTETTYGDYQVDLDLGKDADGNAVDAEKTFDTISAVILSTEQGHDYGLRHLENIWRRTELSWGVGYTTKVHNCPVSSDHYKAIQGETITKITYITSNGIFTIDTELYVPVKDGVVNGLAVADAKVDAKTTDVTVNLPSDYQAKYTAPAGATVADGKLTWDSILPGTYTLKVEDASGKYAPVSTTFTLSTDTAPTQAAEDTFSVVKTEAASNEEFANYLKNITAVTVNGTKYAATGRGSVKVIKSDGSIDFTTTPFQSAGVDGKYVLVISSTGYPDVTVTVEEYVYAYASLTYGEYWANEDVYAHDNTTASETKDSNGETDQGGFDAVTRATTNHGLYRASFQQSATITCENGTKLDVDYFKDAQTLVLTDGTEVQYIGALSDNCYFVLADGTQTKLASYTITGIKYVPVAVKSWEFSEFAKNYDVTVNGTTINGGSPNEGNVKPYTYVTEVNADTNGLKVATLTDRKWSFSARKTGTGSGLKDVELKTAPELTASVNDTSKFGDFIRVDITDTAKQYGLLGAAMETVVWTYYGNDDTYTNALETYGTKFAADNWMHSKSSIQLGLSNSVRCQMPEGYDGSGYWTVTIYAMGYSDTSYKVKVETDDLHDASVVASKEDKAKLETLAAEVKALMDAYDEANATDAVKTAYQDLSAHYNEATELLATTNPTSAAVQELLTDLPNVISAYNSALNASKPITLSNTVTTNPDEDNEFDAYETTVTLTVVDGKITDVAAFGGGDDNAAYVTKALNGTKSKTGIKAQLVGKTVEELQTLKIDTVSGATCSSNAIIEGAKTAK